MEWLNLHTSILDSPEVIGADPEQRGTWLMLLRYCIGQENSGLIENCADWKDRKWQQIVRVTQAETQACSDLWTWEGNNLRVVHYPIEKEAIVKGGRKGGRSKTPAKTQASRTNGANGGRKVTQATTQGKTQQKGREGNGMEEEGKLKKAATADRARLLCNAHPYRSESGSALQAALKALSRHPFETIMAGTVAYAECVSKWTDAERGQFVTNPERFFLDDVWNQSPDAWRSRIKDRRTNGQTHHRHIDTGGRDASGVFTGHLQPDLPTTTVTP